MASKAPAPVEKLELSLVLTTETVEDLAEKLEERLLPHLLEALQAKPAPEKKAASEEEKKEPAKKPGRPKKAAGKRTTSAEKEDQKALEKLGVEARNILRQVYSKKGEEAAKSIMEELKVEAVCNLEETGLRTLIGLAEKKLAEKEPEEKKEPAGEGMFA